MVFKHAIKRFPLTKARDQHRLVALGTFSIEMECQDLRFVTLRGDLAATGMFGFASLSGPNAASGVFVFLSHTA